MPAFFHFASRTRRALQSAQCDARPVRLLASRENASNGLFSPHFVQAFSAAMVLVILSPHPCQRPRPRSRERGRGCQLVTAWPRREPLQRRRNRAAGPPSRASDRSSDHEGRRRSARTRPPARPGTGNMRSWDRRPRKESKRVWSGSNAAVLPRRNRGVSRAATLYGIETAGAAAPLRLGVFVARGDAERDRKRTRLNSS